LHRFYEWQEVKGGGQKQPYFIYFKENIKQKEKIDVEENDIMLARPLLTMAGIFDVWKSPSVWSMARS
jgi:putative SOS response-associated peptidase YedK